MSQRPRPFAPRLALSDVLCALEPFGMGSLGVLRPGLLTAGGGTLRRLLLPALFPLALLFVELGFHAGCRCWGAAIFSRRGELARRFFVCAQGLLPSTRIERCPLAQLKCGPSCMIHRQAHEKVKLMFRPERVPSTMASAVRPGFFKVIRARGPVENLVPAQDLFRPPCPIGTAAATGVPARLRALR